MSKPGRSLVFPLSITLSLFLIHFPAQAAQFSYLDPSYQQEIYSGPMSPGDITWGPGMAWGPGGNLLIRSHSTFYQYSLTADTVYNGTNVHSETSFDVSGLGYGYGMTNNVDGYIYANTLDGLARIDTTTWTATTLPGTSGGIYGIGALFDGRIVYNANNVIHIYDPVLDIDSAIYAPGVFIDDLAIAPTGEIFLAVLGDWTIRVIDQSGALINSVATAHGPDGMAFGGGSVFANNTDGTISRLDFDGPGYTGSATFTPFASGGAYGDLAAVGPDGAFYVSQWGSEYGGITWDDGTVTHDNVIVKISLANGGGGFDPGSGSGKVPEPGTLFLMAGGFAGMMMFRRMLV